MRPVVRSDPGRKARFRRLYDSYHDDVLAYAVRRLAFREDAEDVTAETFQIAWRRLDEIERSPKAWLLAVAHHRVLNKVRGRRRQAALAARLRTQEPPGRVSIPGREISDEAEEALAALSSLTESDRETLMLVAWDDLSYREAAQVLGVSVTAFSLRLVRARRRLARATERTLKEAPELPEVASKEERR